MGSTFARRSVRRRTLNPNYDHSVEQMSSLLYFYLSSQLAEELSQIVGIQQARVIDLCCGTGFSTRALQNAFPDAETVLGIDTSAEMVSAPIATRIPCRRAVSCVDLIP